MIGCAAGPVTAPPPDLAVGDVLLSIDHHERLDRHERAVMPADPVYVLELRHFRIERRADGSAGLWLDDEHWLELVAPAPRQLTRQGEWCLTPTLMILLDRQTDIGAPLGAVPRALAQYLRRTDVPARDQAANLAAYLLGRSIVPFHGQTQTHRISGRLMLSEEGRRMLLNAVAVYYAELRGLDRPGPAR